MRRKYQDSLFSAPRKKRPWIGITLLLLAIALMVVYFFNMVNNGHVKLLKQSVTVPSLPSAMEGYKILHISDLHGIGYGKNQSNLMSSISTQNYNMVCITGDMLGPDGETKPFLDLIAALPENVPVYFIPGDEDPAAIVSKPHGNDSAKADYIVAAEELGAIYVDAPIKITVGKSVMWLWPLNVYTMDLDTQQDALDKRHAELMTEPETTERRAMLQAVEYQQDQVARIRAAKREMAEVDFHMALTHHPLTATGVYNLREWHDANPSYISSLSLVLAGHYVNGQWRLPIVGAVYAPPSAGYTENGWFPGEELSGLSATRGMTQYISPGLGAASVFPLPALRLFNTPAMTILTLTTKMTQ